MKPTNEMTVEEIAAYMAKPRYVFDIYEQNKNRPWVVTKIDIGSHGATIAEAKEAVLEYHDSEYCTLLEVVLHGHTPSAQTQTLYEASNADPRNKL